MLYCILEEKPNRPSVPKKKKKIEKRLLLCRQRVYMHLDACVFTRGFARAAFGAAKKVRPRQGAFCLSAAAVSSFIELEFIIQPFFCVMSSRAGGRWRGREREGEEKRGSLATAQECVPIG